MRTYFYRETPNALYEENVIALIHNLYLSNKKTIYLKTISSSPPLSHPLGIHPLTPIWTRRNVAHLDSMKA